MPGPSIFMGISTDPYHLINRSRYNWERSVAIALARAGKVSRHSTNNLRQHPYFKNSEARKWRLERLMLWFPFQLCASSRVSKRALTQLSFTRRVSVVLLVCLGTVCTLCNARWPQSCDPSTFTSSVLGLQPCAAIPTQPEYLLHTCSLLCGSCRFLPLKILLMPT